MKAPGANDTTMKAKAYLPPIPVLNSAARGVAYVNIDLDKDGEARSYPTVVRFSQRYCVPLFLALVDAYSHHTRSACTSMRKGCRLSALAAAGFRLMSSVGW